MILYHYTNRYGIDGIRAVGLLKPSPKKEKTFVPPWLSLTTDPASKGHGLPDGRELPRGHIGLPSQVINGKHHCFDHTECRIVVDLDPADPDLVRAQDYHSAEEIEILEVRGYFPTSVHVSSDAMEATKLLVSSGALPGKSSTWWYYKKAIPVSPALSFEQRNKQGLYVRVP